MRIRFQKGRQQLSVLLAIAMLVSILVPFGSVQVAEASPRNDQVVISQVYGGGGGNGAVYANDFIELFNPTGQAVDLTGWKVRYASAAGDFNNTTSLTGSIEPYQYLLIQQSGGNTGQPLPTPDLTGNMSLAASNGKVDLVNAAGERVDLIGYGSANASESNPTAALSADKAAIRKELAGGPVGNRGLDTDNNAEDFYVGAPAPATNHIRLRPEIPAAA